MYGEGCSGAVWGCAVCGGPGLPTPRAVGRDGCRSLEGGPAHGVMPGVAQRSPTCRQSLGCTPNPFHPYFHRVGGSPVLPGEPALTEFGVSGEVLRGSTTEPHFVPNLGVFRARNESRARISVASSSITLQGDIQGMVAIQGSPKMTKKSGKREIFVPFFSREEMRRMR